MTKTGWNVPVDGPETNTEVLRNEKARKNSKSELVQNRLSDRTIDNAYDRRKIDHVIREIKTLYPSIENVTIEL